MSFRVYFSMSSGLSKSLSVPEGTLKEIMSRIRFTEFSLGFVTEQYKDNPNRWLNTEPKDGVSDDLFCEVAENHNDHVRRLYDLFAECEKNPVEGGEVITPEDAREFWHGLQIIDVPPHRWTRDYYVERMRAFYEVMRDGKSEGMTFDAEALSPVQADGVINLFASLLDRFDVDLAVPRDRDYLAARDDGGYEWCDKCGAVIYEDALRCCTENCPLKEEFEAELELEP